MTEVGFDEEKINRFFSGNFSDDDELYVEDVFCDKEREDELRYHLLRQFHNVLNDNDLKEKDLDHILYRIHYAINTNSQAKRFSRFGEIVKWTYRIAGIIMLPVILFIGIHIYKDTNQKLETWVEIKAPAWTRAQFSLPDGTAGWLNSNSSVKYNGNFNVDRHVELKGEAFFDVYKDKSRPFVVEANNVELEVTGTRFNFASYENENSIEVVLEEGELIFKNEDTNRSYTMQPNDLIVYDKKLMDYYSEVVEPHKYIAWTEGKLVFRNDQLDVIARRLERWYNIDVEIDGVYDEDMRLRATFIDEGLEEVLDLLKLSLHINYKIENRDIKPDDSFSKKRVIILPVIN